MSQIITYINLFLEPFVDWFLCIRSPIITCHKILDLAISDKEKIYFTFRVWITAFLLSFSLELPIYYYYGIGNEYSFYISYTIIGFLYLLISSIVIHVILLIFNIKSIYIETLVCYTIVIVTYSPIFLLFSWLGIFDLVQSLKTIKREQIDILNNITKMNDLLAKINHHQIILFISSFAIRFNVILFSITGVLMAYLITERYNSNKFKSFLSITFALIFLLFPLILLSFLKYTILYIYLK